MASKGKEIICKKCGRIGKLCARGLCNTCYDDDIQSRKIRKCNNCGEMKPHHSHGLCGKCYRKISRDNDKFRKQRRDGMRERRVKFPDLVRLLDRLRHKTQKRQQWKHEYAQRDYVKAKNVKHVTQYRKDNKDKSDIWGHARRARIRGLPHDLTVDEWNKILAEHNYCCHYCRKQSTQLQKEHRIPVSRGGGFTKENIVPACPTCNYRKNDMTDSEFFEYLRKYPSREAGG